MILCKIQTPKAHHLRIRESILVIEANHVVIEVICENPVQ